MSANDVPVAGGLRSGLRIRPPRDLGTWGPVIAFLLIIVVFSILAPTVFPTTGSALAILNDQAVLAILACGVTLVLLTGEFDLSAGSNLSFTGAISAVLMANLGVPVWLVLPLCLIAGALVGWVNGMLVVYFGIPALIATLAVATVLDGMTLWITGGSVIYQGIPEAFVQLGRAEVFGISLPILFMAITAVVLWAALKYTPAGRYLHAIGGNRDAARVSGIRVNRYVIFAFVVCGMFGAFAGMLQTARNASAHPTIGAAFLLPAFAACFLGSATLRRGEFHIPGTVLGVYLIATASSGLFILGAPYWTQYLFSGFILVIATASSRFLTRNR